MCLCSPVILSFIEVTFRTVKNGFNSPILLLTLNIIALNSLGPELKVEQAAGGPRAESFCSFSFDIEVCFLQTPWYIFSSYEVGHQNTHPSPAAPAPSVEF